MHDFFPRFVALPLFGCNDKARKCSALENWQKTRFFRLCKVQSIWKGDEAAATTCFRKKGENGNRRCTCRHVKAENAEINVLLFIRNLFVSFFRFSFPRRSPYLITYVNVMNSLWEFGVRILQTEMANINNVIRRCASVYRMRVCNSAAIRSTWLFSFPVKVQRSPWMHITVEYEEISLKREGESFSYHWNCSFSVVAFLNIFLFQFKTKKKCKIKRKYLYFSSIIKFFLPREWWCDAWSDYMLQ